MMAADRIASHAGWLLMRGGALRRWQNRYFALFPGSPGGAPALRYKALPGDTAWAGVLLLDGVSAGALPLGDGHPTAACFYIHRQGKTYVLAASSEAEVQRWLSCIADELRAVLNDAAAAARRGSESPRITPPRAALPWLGGSGDAEADADDCGGVGAGSEAALSDDDGGSDAGCPSPAAAAAAAGAEVRALNGVWRGVLAARDASLQAALRAAEAERARAERCAMRAEDERATMLAAARAQRAAAARWRAATRRALVRLAVSDAARAAAETQLATDRAAREAEAAARAEEAVEAERQAAARAQAAEAAARAAAQDAERRLRHVLLADAATAHWWHGPPSPRCYAEGDGDNSAEEVEE